MRFVRGSRCPVVAQAQLEDVADWCSGWHTNRARGAFTASLKGAGVGAIHPPVQRHKLQLHVHCRLKIKKGNFYSVFFSFATPSGGGFVTGMLI